MMLDQELELIQQLLLLGGSTLNHFNSGLIIAKFSLIYVTFSTYVYVQGFHCTYLMNKNRVFF